MKSTGHLSGSGSLLRVLSAAHPVFGSVPMNASRELVNPSQSGSSGGTCHGGVAPLGQAGGVGVEVGVGLAVGAGVEVGVGVPIGVGVVDAVGVGDPAVTEATHIASLKVDPVGAVASAKTERNWPFADTVEM